MLTQWHLPPPLTGSVKSSLFTHAHSSPLSLAARLHQCHSNPYHYFNNGWAFSGQASCRLLIYDKGGPKYTGKILKIFQIKSPNQLDIHIKINMDPISDHAHTKINSR